MYLISQQDCELKFANAIVGTVLKESDLMKIKQRSVWNEGQKEWSVPSFLIQDKKADCNFPTINGRVRA